MILGKIDSIDAEEGLKVIVDGEDSPTTKKYNYLSSYVPTQGDHVLIEEIGGSYVIIGKVISEVTSSGIVRHASSADSATSATNANHATTATSATSATSATTAASCSGNAATSTVSDKTKGFDSSVRSENGSLVTRVYSQYVSSLGMNVVTDVYTSSSHDFVYK